MRRQSVQLLAISLWLLAIASASARPARCEPMPRLVLLLAIDQLRPDRVDSELPGGLGRLTREGRLYTEATLDHAMTETCAGHATMLTGQHPAHAGVPGNHWLDREAGKVRYCVEDSADDARVFGSEAGRSPRGLRVSTLGDWMKAVHPTSRVFAVSGKDRAAIMLGGKTADAAYWLNQVGDVGFTSSGYYMDRLPAWVGEFNGRNPPNDGFLAHIPSEWRHLGDVGGAPGRPDDFVGESKRFRRTSGHPLRDDDLEEFATRLFASPFLDEATLDFATLLVEQEKLGRGPSPDLLAVSLSATDVIGHLYGPYSHESRDALQRLDAALGRFLARLEQELGPGAVLAVLTSDHGVLPLPEWLAQTGGSRCPVPGGRRGVWLLGLQLRLRLHWKFSPLLSTPRPWLVFAEQQLAVDRSLAERYGVRVADVVALTRTILEAEPAITKVWTPEEIENGTDELARLYRNSFDPERGGDLLVQIAPTCIISSEDEGTNHMSPYLYDRAVPLIFWGTGITGGRVSGPAHTVDIAPTLARRLGIAVPAGLDGRPLFD